MCNRLFTRARIQLALVGSLAATTAPCVAQATPDQSSATPPAVTAAPAAGESADSVALGNLAEITVRDRRAGPLRTPEVLTSTNVLEGDAVQQQSVGEPLQLLKRVAGMYMEDYGQGIVTAGLALRGFDTQGDVPALRLTIDGIPSNLHVGTSELKGVFPFEIDRVEVVKGTNDPRYGLNNVAGNVNVFTRRAFDLQLARVLAGSFSTVEPQLLVGSRTGPFDQTYFLGYRSSQGFREHARSERLAGSGKWFYEPHERLRVGLIARGLFFDAEAPGYLTRAQVHATPRMSPEYARDDEGRERALHLSTHFDYQIAAGLSLSLKAYAQTFGRDRYVRFDPELSQQLRRERELQHGAIGVLTYRARLGGVGLGLELGADYQAQQNVHQRYNTLVRVRQGAAVRDQDFRFNTAGVYLQASVKPVPTLKLVGALRADHLWGDMHDRAADARYRLQDYGLVWQPKLSATWTFLHAQRLYANYGRTFQVNTGIGAYATSPGTTLAPSRNDGWEAGLHSTLSRWLTGRVAVWQQLASREVRLKFDNTGDSENVGRTSRYGLDVEASVTPLPWLNVWGAFSPVIAKQTEPGGPQAAARQGKALDHVPWYSAKAGLDYTRRAGLWVSLWLYAQGSYYLTKENDGERVGDYFVLNLDAKYPLETWLELGLSIQNLLDNRYAAAIWYKDYGQTGALYAPGAPLSVYVSATVTL